MLLPFNQKQLSHITRDTLELGRNVKSHSEQLRGQASHSAKVSRDALFTCDYSRAAAF